MLDVAWAGAEGMPQWARSEVRVAGQEVAESITLAQFDSAVFAECPCGPGLASGSLAQEHGVR